MTIKTIKCFLLPCMMLFVVDISAQQQTTDIEHILQQELENAYGTWRHGSNAAGLGLDRPSSVSLLEVGYGKKSGNFRRPQDASTALETRLHTFGNTEVLGSYIQGYFTYQRDNRKEAEYNASLVDPFRSMPYLAADTNASDWVNQHYRLGFDVATREFGNGWYGGLSVDYQATSGAKQRDMRARNGRYVLEISPGVVYKVSPKHEIGVNLSYENHKEESNNYNVNVYVNQGHFLLYGLGHGIPKSGYDGLSASRTVNYTGDRIGVGLQYRYTDDWEWFASAGYAIGAEDAIVSFTNPRPEFTLLQQVWRGKLRAQRPQGKWGHLATVDFVSTQSRGIEYLNEFIAGVESDGFETRFSSVRSTYGLTAVSGHYELVRNRNRAYDWKISADIHYDKRQDIYLIPTSHFDIKQLSYGVTVHRAFSLKPSVSSLLDIGVHVRHSQNLHTDYHYGGFFPESLPVVDLMVRDVAFLSSDYLHIGLPLIYSQRLSQQHGVSLFVRVGGYYTKSDHALFDNRQEMQFSVGSTF